MLLVFFLSIISSQVVNDSIPGLLEIDIIPRTGETIPLNLEFVNTRNEHVVLSEYFDEDTPVLMVLAYSNCPMLCSLVLDGVVDGVGNLEWLPGDKFRMLTVSIDPNEKVSDASRRQGLYLRRFKEEVKPENWDFLVGEEKNIKTLADALGFEYYYDENIQQFAHPAVLFVLTGKGIISRYHFGLDFPERDLRFSLMEASQGKIGNTFDKLLLYCFQYDPDAQGYVLVAAQTMKLGGLATVIIGVFILTGLWLKEKKKNYGKI